MKINLIFLIFILTFKSYAVDNNWRAVDVKFHCDRIYAVNKISNKEQLFFTDSGGGLSPFVFKNTVKPWNVSNLKYNQFKEGNYDFVLANTKWPKNIKIGFYPDNTYLKGLKVVDCVKEKNNEFCFLKSFMKDGFIGADWYADKAWKLDYKNKKVSYSRMSSEITGAERIGFKVLNGKRVTHQPTMSIEIDGKKYFMLFDTGATANYSSDARKTIKLKDQFCGASFMKASLFDLLSKKYPLWKIIKSGDHFSGGSDLLKIPAIKVGGHIVGPIWFAKRSNAVYEKYSKKYVDRPIDGAVGGNILKNFLVTIDYIGNQIRFDK